ncbi:MAG TPA: NADH-quinone oxidoreductase subunit H, partial [Oligella sp.]|nr:NADH-quinone oxidoreductase subunit H [Oligella sp.]
MNTNIWAWFTDGVAAVNSWGANLLGETPWMVLWTIILILVIAMPIIICVAFLTLWERRMIGYMHMRRGPNRV